MTILFGGLNRAGNNSFIYGGFNLSSQNTPESWIGNWILPAAPIAVEGNSSPAAQAPSAAAHTSPEPTDVIALRTELDHVKGQLSALQSILRDLTYGTDARLSFFEQKYQHDQVKSSRIRHAQEQQLERRLQQHIKISIVEAMQQAMDKFIRVRRSVASEPPKHASTYKVPARPKSEGLFR